MEKKIMNEFVQEGEASEDGVDEAVSAISEELKRRGMVLELLCDMDEVRSRLGDKTVRLKDELESVGEMLCNAKGEGGYMTICVRPLGDTMMLMCEMRFKEGIGEHGSKTITRVL